MSRPFKIKSYDRLKYLDPKSNISQEISRNKIKVNSIDFSLKTFVQFWNSSNLVKKDFIFIKKNIILLIM